MIDSQSERYHAAFPTLHAIRIPRPVRVMAWLILLGLVLTTALLAVTPWVQTTSGNGQITSLDPRDRVQEIHALVSGRIEQWYVRDGAQVKAGDLIVKIIDNDPLLIERLEAERATQARKLDAARIATQTAELDYNRQEALYEEGLVARLQYENARIRLEEMRVQQAQATSDLNQADVNLSRQSIQEVVAPRDGTILQLISGDTATAVKEGQTLATFIPANAKRSIELYIDGRDIPLVTPGRKVRIQFEGWPAVQFSGWPSIAIGTFPGVVAVVDQSAQLDGRFRVLVTEAPSEQPWPEQGFVRFGAKARGWILLDTVTLGYELWRRMNNFPPNFTGQPAQLLNNE